MPSLFSSKPKDGAGLIRISYCGFVKAPGGGQTTGRTSKSFSAVPNAATAQNFVITQLNNNSIKDSFGNVIGKNTNYQLGQYTGYTESKSQPGKFYHDFVLTHPEDSFCHSGGIKRRTRKRRSTKKRNARRKSTKSRSRR
jgi:hypothetical protein